MKPKRIQRKRIKGWTNPTNTIYVGRPTKWGNPFKVGEYKFLPDDIILNPFSAEPKLIKTLDMSLKLYEQHIRHELKFKRLNLNDLKGKNLSCWCNLSKRCHVDILLKLINETETSNAPIE